MLVDICEIALNRILIDIINLAHNIERILISLPQYRNARQIGIYLSMPKNEVSTREIVLHALQQEKKVFVPFTYKVTPSPNKPKDVMDLVSLHSRDDYESLQLDAWGIPTPSKESVWERTTCLEDDEITCKQTPRREPSHVHLDMIIMPGMAFDKKLGRLGHGKGFYDFFLQRYQKSKDINQSARITMPFLGKFMMIQAFCLKENLMRVVSSWT